METPNIFTDDTDINIIKSWLCNSTDGQTYSISDRFLPRIHIPDDLEWDFCDIEEEWDNIIGSKHDYKVDDAEMEKRAALMLCDINYFIDKVNERPSDYFSHEKQCESKNIFASEDALHAAFVKHCNKCDCPMGCIHRQFNSSSAMLDTRCASILKCFARFVVNALKGGGAK